MESTPSSGPETPAPLTRRTNPALAVRTWSRSRRVQTFGLGALCGALGLALLVVVTSILGAPREQAPLLSEDPASVTEVRPTPSATPESTPTSTPAATETTEATDAASDDEAAEPAPEPVPMPAPTADEPPPPDDSAASPGKSGSAPGKNKPPKNP
jgi:cytoskeletal protein RodZ